MFHGSIFRIILSAKCIELGTAIPAWLKIYFGKVVGDRHFNVCNL